MHQKLAPDLFLILLNNPKNHCMQDFFQKTTDFGIGLSKSLKNVNFIFLLNPVPLMVKVIKNK